MVKFLHTSDWQLGMTRHYLEGEAQGRFSQARLDALRRMAELAAERECAFVVVAGDVFDNNQPDRRTIGRALEALKSFTVPVYLLPGNHDAYDPGSVYRSEEFRDGCPSNVEVLADREPHTPVNSVEVVGAPWTSRRPLEDLVSESCAGLEADGALRVLVGHGTMSTVSGDFGDPGSIQLPDVEVAVAEGRVSYVALGDRHSALQVGDTGRIWYSGAPEPTGYREQRPGRALVVELDENAPNEPPQVEEVQVGTWTYHELDKQVYGDQDLDELISDLEAIRDKARAIVKVKVYGTLTLTQVARLEELLEGETRFGALEHPERHKDVTVAAKREDVADLPLTGYAAIARDRLLERNAAGGEDAETAADALGLLVRLAREP